MLLDWGIGGYPDGGRYPPVRDLSSTVTVTVSRSVEVMVTVIGPVAVDVVVDPVPAAVVVPETGSEEPMEDKDQAALVYEGTAIG